MGYARKWVPPSIPLRNNLAAWKTICSDIDTNMIASGLVRASDTGQLDINAVSSLPADDAFAGYHVYRFNDALQATAPIFIRLEYGCGVEGLYGNQSSRRTRTIRIKIIIGQASDGAGNIVDGTEFQCPQTYSGLGFSTTQLINAGWSAITYNEDRGFFGIAYGVGSRNDPWAGTAGSYYGSTLCFFIQRTHTAYGVPTQDGFLLYYPNITSSSTNTWYTNDLQNSQMRYYSYVDGWSAAQSQYSNRLDKGTTPFLDGKVHMMPMFTLGKDRMLSMSTVVQYLDYTIGAQNEISVETIPGTPENFICLGNRTSLSPSNDFYQQSSVAMLFE